MRAGPRTAREVPRQSEVTKPEHGGECSGKMEDDTGAGKSEGRHGSDTRRLSESLEPATRRRTPQGMTKMKTRRAVHTPRTAMTAPSAFGLWQVETQPLSDPQTNRGRRATCWVVGEWAPRPDETAHEGGTMRTRRRKRTSAERRRSRERAERQLSYSRRSMLYGSGEGPTAHQVAARKPRPAPVPDREAPPAQGYWTATMGRGR